MRYYINTPTTLQTKQACWSGRCKNEQKHKMSISQTTFTHQGICCQDTCGVHSLSKAHVIKMEKTMLQKRSTGKISKKLKERFPVNKNGGKKEQVLIGCPYFTAASCIYHAQIFQPNSVFAAALELFLTQPRHYLVFCSSATSGKQLR